MPAPTVMFLDGFDTSTLDLLVERVDKWRHSLHRAKKTVSVPNEIYDFTTSNAFQGKGRNLLVRANILSVDRATLETNLNALQWRFDKPSLLISFDDRAWGAYTGYLNGEIKVTGYHPAMTGRAVRIDIPFKCPDPRYFEAAQQSIGFTATPVEMPLLEAPVHPVITITVGSFTLTYSGGGTLTVTGASSPPITVDMFNKTIKNSAGASQINALVAGDFFTLDPQDGTHPSGPWGTLATSAGSGTAVYNKAAL